MATPLTASYRMNFAYTVSGYTHRLRQYCKAVIVGGAYKLVERDGTTQITPQNAADGMGNALDNLFEDNNPSTCAWTLENLSGSAWNPVDSGSATVDSGVATAYVPASQITLVSRDTAFKKVRTIVLESNIRPPYHFNALGSNTGQLHAFSSTLWAFCLAFDLAAPEVYSPILWVVSRGNNYLADHGFVGVTGDLNDKIRRGRGLT